jgi:hypothetical protein
MEESSPLFYSTSAGELTMIRDETDIIRDDAGPGWQIFKTNNISKT